MSDLKNNTPTVSQVAAFIDEIAPASYAMPSDNVGLLVGNSEEEVTGILVALDITKNGIAAAIESSCNLIVCHHPVIFSKLSRVTDDSIVYDLIRNGISVIAAHTNLDKAENGVNHALAESLKLSDLSVFENADKVGLVGKLKEPMGAKALALYIKKSLSADCVSYVASDDCADISTVAILGGAGEDYLYDSRAADAYITGEVPHHIYCYAQNAGISLFTAGHYHTERVILPSLCESLSDRFSGVKVKIFDDSWISAV